MNLPKVFSVAVVVGALSGCAAPSFSPTTIEGANCKRQCATDMQGCQGSPYTCDRSYAQCVQSCIDIDRLSK